MAVGSLSDACAWPGRGAGCSMHAVRLWMLVQITFAFFPYTPQAIHARPVILSYLIDRAFQVYRGGIFTP